MEKNVEEPRYFVKKKKQPQNARARSSRTGPNRKPTCLSEEGNFLSPLPSRKNAGGAPFLLVLFGGGAVPPPILPLDAPEVYITWQMADFKDGRFEANG